MKMQQTRFGHEWKVGDVLYGCGGGRFTGWLSPTLAIAEHTPASQFGYGCYSPRDTCWRVATLADADEMITHQQATVEREQERLRWLLEMRAKIAEQTNGHENT